MLKVPLSWVWFIAAFALIGAGSLMFFHKRVEEVGGRFAPGTCLKNEEMGTVSIVEGLNEGSYSLRILESKKFPEHDLSRVGHRFQRPVASLDASSGDRPVPCPKKDDEQP
jgi:hypothetical protein